jgi:hypothetical protein
MKLHYFRFSRLVLVVIGLILGSRTVLALDSASPTPTAGLITPLPSECQIEPLPLKLFEERVRDSGKRIVPPETAGLLTDNRGDTSVIAVTPTIGPSDDSSGMFVDTATVDAVNNTFRDYIACFNAQDPLRQFALFTTSYLNEFLHGDERPFNADDLDWIAATPIPRPPEYYISFVPNDSSYLTAEGGVAAYPLLVNWPFLDEPRHAPVSFIFERGRYRIDRLG